MNVVRVIKSTNTRLERHAECKVEVKSPNRFHSEILNRSGHFGDTNLDGGTVLKSMLKKIWRESVDCDKLA
jgi:hypothetical protein